MTAYARAIRAANAAYKEHVEAMYRAVDDATLDWHGNAARAAAARAAAEAAAGARIAAVVEDLADEFDSRAAELDGYRDVLLRIVDIEAPAAGIAVTDDGVVGSPTGACRSEIEECAAGFASRIAEQLGCFAAAEQRAAATIAGIVEQLDAVSHRSDVADPVTLPSDPVELQQLWQRLSPSERDALFTQDNYLGNRDGLPATDRDHYNRIKLADELARAHAGEPGMVAHRQDLQAVSVAVDSGPDRLLLVLDTQSGMQTRAVVALGNPDIAEHISVTVPGMNTTVAGSLAGMTTEADVLKQTAETALHRAGIRSETVATIAWIGYDAPQFDADHPVSRQSFDGVLAVAGTDNARSGAPALARFYEGIAAANDGDEHLVGVGHSYGSVLTGLALQQPGRHVVDDVLVYGSPGMAAGYDDDAIDKLHIGIGHAYEMTARHDTVAHLSRFGSSPGSQPGFTHLDTAPTTTPDGVRREGAEGHSEYPRPGANGELRTSGYNAAVVVAGLPELAILKP